MPYAAKQPCRSAGCDALVESGHGGFCGVHQAQTTRREYDRARGSSHARGYDREWRKFRLAYLWDNPVCVDCARAVATEVHHVRKLADRPELKFVRSNLMALCNPCHSVRTARGE